MMREGSCGLTELGSIEVPRREIGNDLLHDRVGRMEPGLGVSPVRVVVRHDIPPVDVRVVLWHRCRSEALEALFLGSDCSG